MEVGRTITRILCVLRYRISRLNERFVKLIDRWEKAAQNRLTGADSKPPYAAVVKSHGGERVRNRHERTCQVSCREMNTSGPLRRRRNAKDDVET